MHVCVLVVVIVVVVVVVVVVATDPCSTCSLASAISPRCLLCVFVAALNSCESSTAYIHVYRPVPEMFIRFACWCPALCQRHNYYSTARQIRAGQGRLQTRGNNLFVVFLHEGKPFVQGNPFKRGIPCKWKSFIRVLRGNHASGEIPCTVNFNIRDNSLQRGILHKGKSLVRGNPS